MNFVSIKNRSIVAVSALILLIQISSSIIQFRQISALIVERFESDASNTAAPLQVQLSQNIQNAFADDIAAYIKAYANVFASFHFPGLLESQQHLQALQFVSPDAVILADARVERFGTQLPSLQTQMVRTPELKSLQAEKQFLVFVPYVHQNKFYGGLLFSYSLVPLLEARSQAFFTGLYALVIYLALGGLGAWLISMSIVAPIQRLGKAFTIVAEGHFDHPIDLHRKDELGWLAQSFAFMRDTVREKIAALQSVNAELHNEKAFTEAAIDSQLDTFSVFDPVSGKPLRWNSTFRRISGYNDTEIADMTIPEDWYGPKDLIKVAAAMKTVFEEGQATIELALLTKDGPAIPTEYTAALFSDEEHQMTYIIAIGRDISERKRAEEQIRQLNADLEARVQRRTAALEAANKELREFAYVASHDLKAPLRGISRLVTWLISDYLEELDEEGQHMTDLLLTTVQRMDKLIEGLLHYSQIGRIIGENRTIEIAQLVREVLDVLTPPEHIKITIQAPLPTIEADPLRIFQVFQNLLSNAINFMDKEEGKIEIGCREQDEYWVFWIADNGPGIDPKYHQKIFKLFERLQSHGTHESTGIGLAVVQKIVVFYGGTVWVKSSDICGTTFFFSLPQKPSPKGTKFLPKED